MSDIPGPSKAWVPDDVKWNGYLFEAQATTAKPAKPRRKRNYDNAMCQVEGCDADLRAHKEYHQRYKICEFHLRVPSLLKDGVQQRFCQQCGCFHLLEKFDDAKRSCRAKLQRHNERRRKPAKPKGLDTNNIAPHAASVLATCGSLSGALTDASLGAPYSSAQAGSPSGTSIKRTASGSDDSSCHFSNKRPRSPIFPPNDFVSSVVPLPAQRVRPPPCRSPALNPFQHAQNLPLDVISPFLDPDLSSTSPGVSLMHPHHPHPHLHPLGPPKGPALSSNDSSTSHHHAPSGPRLAGPLAPSHSATTLTPPTGLHHPLSPYDIPSITSPSSATPPAASPARSDIDLLHVSSQFSQPPFPASAPHPSLCLDPLTSSAPPNPGIKPSPWDDHLLHPAHDADPDPLAALPSAVLTPPPHLTAPQLLPGHPASGPPDVALLPQDFRDSLSLVPESYAYQKEFDINTPAAIAMSAPLPDSIFHPVMDSPMLGPPQPNDRSHAWLTPQHILEPPPEYHQWERLTTVSLKLFNCGPSDLPVTLRQDLMLMIDDVQLMEGFIRPGCVLLTVDTFLPTSTALPAPAQLGARLTLAHPTFWAGLGASFEVRHGASLAARFTEGRLQEGGPEEAPAPQITAVLPLCISDPAQQRLLLRCRVADTDGMRLFCRANGGYLELPDVSRVEDKAVLQQVGAQEGEVVLRVTLPEDCPSTLLKLELVCNGRVGPLAVALVAGSAAVAQEVNELLLPRLAQVQRPPSALQRLIPPRAPTGHLAGMALPDIARCLDLATWLRQEYNAARCEVHAEHESRPSYSPQEVACIVRAARQLLALCCELGWTYTFMALVTIASIGCHTAAEVLAAAAAAGPKQLPLLHLAVRSRKPEMVQLLLDWGIHHGMVWTDVGVGPAQITALQLAEALEDGGAAIAELICDALDSDDPTRTSRNNCECGSDASSEDELPADADEDEDEDEAEAEGASPAPAAVLPAAAAAAAASAGPATLPAALAASAAATAGGSGGASAAPAGGSGGASPAPAWSATAEEVGSISAAAGGSMMKGSSSKGWEAGPQHAVMGEDVVKPAAVHGDDDSPVMDEEEDLKPRPREPSMVRALKVMLCTGKQVALLFMVLAFINLTMSLLALFAKDEVEAADLVLVEPALAHTVPGAVLGNAGG